MAGKLSERDRQERFTAFRLEKKKWLRVTAFRSPPEVTVSYPAGEGGGRPLRSAQNARHPGPESHLPKVKAGFLRFQQNGTSQATQRPQAAFSLKHRQVRGVGGVLEEEAGEGERGTLETDHQCILGSRPRFWLGQRGPGCRRKRETNASDHTPHVPGAAAGAPRRSPGKQWRVLLQPSLCTGPAVASVLALLSRAGGEEQGGHRERENILVISTCQILYSLKRRHFQKLKSDFLMTSLGEAEEGLALDDRMKPSCRGPPGRVGEETVCW